MASITIRNLEDPLEARLRIRAAHHGRSMEDEARHILHVALTEESKAVSASSSHGKVEAAALKEANRQA